MNVTVVDGSLHIIGDAGSNSVHIQIGEALEEIFVSPLFGDRTTTINGGASFTAHEVTGAVSFKMGAGDDYVRVEDITVPANLDVDGGAGSDTIVLIDMRAKGGIKITTGAGHDHLNFEFARSDGSCDIRTGSGDDGIGISASSEFVGKTTIQTGTGDDWVGSEGTAFRDAITIATGAGDDLLHIETSTFDGDARFLGGPGMDSFVDPLGDNAFNGTLVLQQFE